LKSKNFGLYDDEFDAKKVKDYYEHQDKKNKQLYGNFRQSYFHDNGKEVD